MEDRVIGHANICDHRGIHVHVYRNIDKNFIFHLDRS